MPSSLFRLHVMWGLVLIVFAIMYCCALIGTNCLPSRPMLSFLQFALGVAAVISFVACRPRIHVELGGNAPTKPSGLWKWISYSGFVFVIFHIAYFMLHSSGASAEHYGDLLVLQTHGRIIRTLTEEEFLSQIVIETRVRLGMMTGMALCILAFLPGKAKTDN